MLIVNREKCKRDRICAAECPARIIAFKEKDAYPTPTAEAEGQCLRCGHCVAVCPHEAITIDGIELESCEPIKQELFPSAQQIEVFLKSRRSIRKFKKQPVDRALLERILDMARYAPTAHNSQSVHWLVVEDKAEVQYLAGQVAEWMRYIIANFPDAAGPMHMDRVVATWEQGIDRICRDAPHIIMAHGPQEVGATSVSCTIALAHLELAAYSLGLGACWAGYLAAAAGSFPPLIERLALPEGHKVYGAMMVGYPQYVYHRIPPRTPARVIWR